jgi:hypothetical protein
MGNQRKGERQMTFRDREKLRYRQIKAELFSPAAQQNGLYGDRPRDFCLGDGCSEENLYAGSRAGAIRYFADRRILWHDGANGRSRPSNHLCCSQACCVNFLFPFAENPDLLARVFRHVYPDLLDALPIDSKDEPPLAGGGYPYVAFEWIGEADYLSEQRRKQGEASRRTRGAHYTSADFALRFRRADGRVQLVLGEWKYTESFGSADFAAAREIGSRSGEVRLATYRAAFQRPRGVFSHNAPGLYRELFFGGLYQCLRLQLLAQEMEQARELGADIVSVLHVSPRANREFRGSMPSRFLAERFPGKGVLEIWPSFVPPDQFKSLSVEDLLATIGQEARAASPEWVGYLERRYGWVDRP